jgi:hypothetical protein
VYCKLPAPAASTVQSVEVSAGGYRRSVTAAIFY